MVTHTHNTCGITRTQWVKGTLWKSSVGWLAVKSFGLFVQNVFMFSQKHSGQIHFNGVTDIFLPCFHSYTHGWKMDILCQGNVHLSICPSICLSVSPFIRVLQTFFSTCFEISIWNLVYAFSRWHDMSSLSLITIGSLRPTLQLKVGQTHFLRSYHGILPRIWSSVTWHAALLFC